ncbi:MAG: hypothetical protein JXD23_11080 [Spirochaetales bacterium]|nr:hypothetical protein [Spirochaetales bacterium]
MSVTKLIAVCCVFTALLAAGCGGNREYKDALDRALKEKSGADLFGALLALDQRYPDTFELKSRLGAMFLGADDLDKAETYLGRAEALSASASGDPDRYDLALNLGVLQFERKKYADSLANAERALSLSKEDSRGAVFLKARSLSLLGKNDEAAALYEARWKERALMSRLDLDLYFDHSLENKSLIRAVEILGAGQERFDFTPGQGIQASHIYEELGMIDEAVLCAGMELEYLHSLGGADQAKARERLAVIGKKLEDKTWNPKGAGTALLKGLDAWFAADWIAAARAFTPLSPNHYYFSYLTLASALESEGATADLLTAYVELERFFKSLPGYYYHFWRGMKKGRGDFTFTVAKDVLEKTILLAPDTGPASETRREIARLLGLDPADGAKLLLPAELEALGARLAGGDPVSVLEPAVGLLSLPDNVYTLQGIVFLRGLSRRVPAVESFLKKKKTAAAGRIKERLVMIVGN